MTSEKRCLLTIRRNCKNVPEKQNEKLLIQGQAMAKKIGKALSNLDHRRSISKQHSNFKIPSIVRCHFRARFLFYSLTP